MSWRHRAFILGLVWAANIQNASGQVGPVGSEFQVNVYTTGDQVSPSVSGDALGNFVVVWSQNVFGEPLAVFARRFRSDGAALGQEFRFSDRPSRDAVVSVADDGKFVAVSTSFDTVDNVTRLWGQRFLGNGQTSGSEFRVNTFDPPELSNPAVGSDSVGDFVVVWQAEFDFPGRLTVLGQRFGSDGVRLGAEFLVPTYTSGLQGEPAIARESDGDFIVVWTGNGQGDAHGIFRQRFQSSGAKRGQEFRVNTATTGYQFFPSVASDDTGDFVVVWTSSDQDGEGVSGQRYHSSGAPLGTEFAVNVFTTGTQRGPEVRKSANGDFVVVWSSKPQDGSDYGVFGRRFLSGGSALGGEFQVNTFTILDQSTPSLSVRPDGEFVTVWGSTHSSTIGQDGSDSGIFGQLGIPEPVPTPPALCSRADGCFTFDLLDVDFSTPGSGDVSVPIDECLSRIPCAG